MPRAVELHLVDAVAVAVVRAQHRPVLVGEPPPLLLRLAAHQAAQRRGPLCNPAGTLPLDGLDQRTVAGEDVDPLERRRLVEDRVRLPRSSSLALACGLHGGSHASELSRWAPRPPPGCSLRWPVTIR